MKRMPILMAVLGTAFYVHSAVVDLKDVGDLEVTALDSATDYTNTGDELRTLTDLHSLKGRMGA